jgi:hypothetical protein
MMFSPMYWLTFDNGALQVMIIQAGHLAEARLKAGMLGQKGTFKEGHLLDDETAKRIPRNMISRTLSRNEANALLKKFDGNDHPKA